jgi:predicted PurR-regulated permease PerM
MAADAEVRISTATIAVVAIAFAAYEAASVFAPLAIALFVIGTVWPLQHWLQVRMPKLVALAITLMVTIAVCLAFASLTVWAFSSVGRSLVADAPRYQGLVI